MKIHIKSYPKINLALDILRKTPSGYHEIQTVFHQLPWPFDEMTVELLNEPEIKVACDDPSVPTDQTNTALKAALLLQKNADVSCGAQIFITKKIPLMSGLGGGASNAVAALKALANLWKIKCCYGGLDRHAPLCLLRDIADQIGTDCAFFFDGGTALGENFGEKVTPLQALLSDIKFEIIETGVPVSSRVSYEEINLKKCGKNIQKTQELLAAMRHGDAANILKNLHNDFEEYVLKAHPKIRDTKLALELSHPSDQIILCGSGGNLCKISSRD